jgi:hypothetical protein
MFAAPTVPKSGQGVLLQHCRVSFMTYPLHLNMMIRQTVSHDLVYPQRVSRLTYTAPCLEPVFQTLDHLLCSRGGHRLPWLLRIEEARHVRPEDIQRGHNQIDPQVRIEWR